MLISAQVESPSASSSLHINIWHFFLTAEFKTVFEACCIMYLLIRMEAIQQGVNSTICSTGFYNHWINMKQSQEVDIPNSFLSNISSDGQQTNLWKY